VEADGASLDERRFPGRQGRTVFAYLVVQKGRAVPRDELAELLWGEKPPATWEKALRVLMTKLRALLEECGIDRSTGLTSVFGCYTLTLPADTWIDVEAATAAIERAEAAFAAGDLEEARAEASTAAALCRPTFLPGEEGPWVEDQRRDLRDVLVRALECLRDASLAAEEFGDAARHAAEIIELEPFRESSYRALMRAHVGAGNPAEALRVYERCRRFLGEELGAYPSAETEAIYLELLRTTPKSAILDAAHPETDGIPEVGGPPPRRSRRWPTAAGTAAVLVVVAAVTIATTRGSSTPEVLPTSLVRIDPETLKPTKVIRTAPRADFVLGSGDYLWVTHGILRYENGVGILKARDRSLTRVDPLTGEAHDVPGVAPCGMTPDPSSEYGDVWVLDCYRSSRATTLKLIDARTMLVKQTFRMEKDSAFLRGMTWGGGFLWIDGKAGSRRVIKLNPLTHRRHTIHTPLPPGGLEWSGKYDALWMVDFGSSAEFGSIMRMPAGTERVTTPYLHDAGENPVFPLVQGDSLWVGDWNNADVVRLPMRSGPLGSGQPRHYPLQVTKSSAGITGIAAGFGAIWVTVPDDHALWRIDTKTGERKRIPLGYYPWGVTVAADAIWVTVRAHDAYPDPES
jgi:DNA-binding SARP family transcriptional activator/streptogramin lyase